MRALLIIALGLALSAAGCKRAAAPSQEKCRERGFARTAAYVDKNFTRHKQMIQKALAFLDRLVIDPVALREEGIKGRKKLVELLDAYVAIHRHAAPEDKATLLARFKRAASVTASPGYHDMLTVSDKQFKQDATSYLRACYLMDKMGLPTGAYRGHIDAIKARLDGHMSKRGWHQRMSFKHYYHHFNMAPPKELQDPFSNTLISRRANPYLLHLGQAYDLTHEVFVPHDYGGKLTTDQFSRDDRIYLRRALEVLATVWIARKDVDLVGELLACLRYTGNHDLQVYRDGLSLILASQQPSGAFGDYERLRPKRGDDLDLALYLHTTSVVMDILPLAFSAQK